MDLVTDLLKTSYTFILISLTLLSWRPGSWVKGHGRLIDPPSRATMWRYGFDSKADYDDNSGYCGGKSQLWNRFGGRCGVCGDPWEPRPRAHERGGRYYDGTPVRHYQQGDVINVVMGITANHRGWVEFRLCPYDWPGDDDLEYDDDGHFVEVTQTCLDKHLLHLADGSGTRFYLPEPFRVGQYSVEVRLPPGISCHKCLFQWKWNVANSWGTDPDGTSCLGCGKQEQFYACADIVIESDGWNEPGYPDDYPDTDPPHYPNRELPHYPDTDDLPRPTLPPPPPPKTPDVEPRLPPPQPYPPFFTTGFTFTFQPWNDPDEGKGDYPQGFPGSRGGYPGIDEGNRGFTPDEREPWTLKPSQASPTSAPSVTEKPEVFDVTATLLGVPSTPRPKPTKTSRATPREDTGGRTTRKTDTDWEQPVPNFWRWLLLNHPIRQSSESPVLAGRSTPSSAGGERKPSTRSWWHKLMSLAQRTMFQPNDVSELNSQLHSRSTKSSIATTRPTTTTTTSTTTTPTPTDTTTTTEITKPKNRTNGQTFSQLRSIAHQLKKLVLPVPWWLQKLQRTGPEFLFHSWDKSERRDEVPNQYEYSPDNRFPEDEVPNQYEDSPDINIVAYSGIPRPSDIERNEKTQKVRRGSKIAKNITAVAASSDNSNFDVMVQDAPYSEQSMHSSAALANDERTVKSRDIVLTNEHGFQTVNLGLPFEAANENLFVSPIKESDTVSDTMESDTRSDNGDAGHFNSRQNLQSAEDKSGYLPMQQDNAFYAQEMACTPVGYWIRYRQMWSWCQFHCKGGYCPPSHCMCA